MTDPPILRLLIDVRSSDKNKYTARCPAHVESVARLSIRVEEDGRLIFRCWAGCCNQHIHEALGVAIDSMLPEIDLACNAFPPIQKAFTADDALTGLHKHLEAAWICAHQLSKGIAISSDYRRRMEAISREFFWAHSYINRGAPFDAAVDALTDLCLKLREVSIYATQLANGVGLSAADNRRLAIISQCFQAEHTRISMQQ